MQPTKGMLAAAALQLMVPFLRNHIARAPDTFKIEPAEPIEIPSVLTYTFVPVTGAIIARQVKPAGPNKETKGKFLTTKKRPPPGSDAPQAPAVSKKKKPPPAPKGSTAGDAERDDLLEEEEEEDEADDDGEEEEDEEGEDVDTQLKAVDAIQAKATSKKTVGTRPLKKIGKHKKKGKAKGRAKTAAVV
jgi:hypothetical protein